MLINNYYKLRSIGVLFAFGLMISPARDGAPNMSKPLKTPAIVRQALYYLIPREC